MELKPNCGSERAWVWNVAADYADEASKGETLAIRFANAENAKKFKEVFDDCKEKMDTPIKYAESEKLANELESLKVNEGGEKANSGEGTSEEPATGESTTKEPATEELATSGEPETKIVNDKSVESEPKASEK